MVNKNTLKWSIRVLTVVVTTIAIISFSAYLLLIFPAVQNKTLRLMERKLNASLNGTVAIGSISTNLYSAIDIHNIRITDPTKTGDSLLIDHVHVGYLLPMLLVKRFILTDIVLNGITTSITIRKDGSLPLAQPLLHYLPLFFTKRQNKQARWFDWDILVNRILVNDIRGTLDDYRLQQHAAFREASLQVQIKKNLTTAITVRMKKTSYTSTWWNGIVRSLFADVMVTKNNLKITSVLVNCEKTRFMAKGIIPFTEDGVWDLRGSVATALDAVPILGTTVPGLSSKGFIIAHAAWTGTLAHPLMNIRLRGNNLRMNDTRVDSLMFLAQYTADNILDASVTVTSPSGMVEGTLHGKIPSLLLRPHMEEYAAEFFYRHLKIDEVLQQRPVPIPDILKGIFANGKLTVNGYGGLELPASMKITGSATGTPLGADSLRYEVSLDNRCWDIAVYVNFTKLFSSGRLTGGENIDGTFSLSSQSPSDFTRYFMKQYLDGSVSVDGRITGSIRSPSLHFQTRGEKLAWNGFFIDSLAAAIDYDTAEQHLNSFHISARYNLKNIPWKIDHRYSGSLRTVLSGHGNLFHPDIYAVVEGRHIQVDTTIIDSLHGDFTLRNIDSLQVKKLILRTGSSKIQAVVSGGYSLKNNDGTLVMNLLEYGANENGGTRGTVLLQGGIPDDSLNISLRTSNLSLHLLSSFLPIDQSNGNLDCSAVFSGKPANPVVNAHVTIREPVCNQFVATRSETAVSLVDSTLHLNSTMLVNAAADTVVVHASIPFLPSAGWRIDTTGNYPLAVSIHTKRIPLEQVVNPIDTTWKFGGTATVDCSARLIDREIALSGSVVVKKGFIISHPKKIVATDIEINALLSGTSEHPHIAYRIDGGPASLPGGELHRVTAIGTVTEKMIDIYSVKIALPDSGLAHLDGQLPLKKKGATDAFDNLSINFSLVYLPLKMFTSVLPAFPLQDGTVQGKGTLRYERGKPAVFGNLTLRNGTVITENIDPPIGPVNALLQITGDSIYLPEIDAKWGKGIINAHGIVVMRKDMVPSVMLDLKAKNLTWNTPDIVYGSVDFAELQCTSLSDTFFINGRIQSGSTRYVQELPLADIVKGLRSGGTNNDHGDEWLTKDMIVLDVGIDLQENVIVDMNLGHLKLDGKCMLTGTVAQPSYLGELKAVDGYILYLDRQFIINHATLLNYDKHELHPIIDLEAQADILSKTGDQMDNYSIILSLKGDLENPEFTLKDRTGTLNELEIISILTLGQPLGEMSGDIKDRLRTFLSQSLLGFGSRKLEQFLGIEKFDLQGDFFKGNEGAENARLTIVKRVTPRLMVLYETDIGNLSRPKISALYRIGKNIFLSGERDADGEAGVDIIFKYSK